MFYGLLWTSEEIFLHFQLSPHNNMNLIIVALLLLLCPLACQADSTLPLDHLQQHILQSDSPITLAHLERAIHADINPVLVNLTRTWGPICMAKSTNYILSRKLRVRIHVINALTPFSVTLQSVLEVNHQKCQQTQFNNCAFVMAGASRSLVSGSRFSSICP